MQNLLSHSPKSTFVCRLFPPSVYVSQSGLVDSKHAKSVRQRKRREEPSSRSCEQEGKSCWSGAASRGRAPEARPEPLGPRRTMQLGLIELTRLRQ